MKYIIPTCILFLLRIHVSFSQDEWIVPDDKKSRLSSFEFNDSTSTRGMEIYNINCISCHGDPGKDNWLRLTPPPGDPAASKFQSNTDGELLYKISEGRGQMPSFSAILGQDEIWDVISYLRDYNPDYAQEIAEEIIRSTFGGDISLILQKLDSVQSIQALVIGTSDGETNPMANVPVSLYIERRFGRLPIDEQRLTDENGRAYFNTPNDIPGDSAGNIKIIARLMDEEAYGRVEADSLFAMGIPTNKPSLIAERAMYNTMKKAPVWLLITYSSGVLLAWAIIFYILFQIRKIYMIGKENNDNI